MSKDDDWWEAECDKIERRADRYIKRIRELECVEVEANARIADHRERAEKAEAQLRQAQQCVKFFSSVIKSGEPWTDTCQREYNAALEYQPFDAKEN